MNTKEGSTTQKQITIEFSGGSEKGKSSNDDGHGHGQKKRRPSTNVDGKKKNTNIIDLVSLESFYGVWRPDHF